MTFTVEIKKLSLNEFLTKHPMTYKNLAALLGVTTDAVHNWSCGRRKMTNQILTHLGTLDERFEERPELRRLFIKN